MRTRRSVLADAAGLAGAAGLTGGAGPAGIGGGAGAEGALGDGASVSDGGTAPFEPLGSLDVAGLAEAVVGPDGETVYGSLREGFVVVDASDPADPTELARVTGILRSQGGPVTGIGDVKVSGDRVLVGGPVSSRGPAGFEVHDVSDPANPTRVAGARTDHGIHNCFLDGDVAYLTGTGAPGEPLVIYDVSGSEPAELARWSVADAGYGDVSRNVRSCHDVYVQGDVAYVAYWDAGTWLLDVSDPASPEAIAQLGGVPPEALPGGEPGFSPSLVELPGNAHYVQPNADASLLAVGKEAWDHAETEADGGPGGVELWDVSDPASAERLTVLAPPAEEDHTAHNLGWRGDRLYTSWYGGGVRVFDASDPTAPTLLGEWRDAEHTSFWTAKPAAGCVVASSQTDPSLPEEERRRGEGAALYTFPEPAADVEGSPAGTMTPRPTSTPTTPTTSTASSTTTRPTRTTTTIPTASPAPPTDVPTGTTTDEGATTDGQPGFGVLAALAAGGLAAWRLLDRSRGDGD